MSEIEPRYNCVILTNGSDVDAGKKHPLVDRVHSSFWYLVDDSSYFYRLYKGEDIEQTLLVRGTNVARIDPCIPPVASFHKEEYRWRNERGCIVLEYVPMELTSLRLLTDGKTGIEDFIESLPYRVEALTENQLRAFIYEIELLEDELDDLMSPAQERWLHQIHDILMEESDARWFIQRLQDRGIVHVKRV